jgi:hypothetical protein
MSYATGTPTDQINLLQTLVSWLVSIGWTSDKNASLGFGWEAHLHKGSVYAHLRATVGERAWSSNNEADASGTGLFLYLSTGFNGSNAWDAQPGNPPVDNGGSNVIGAGMNLGYTTPPFSNYYFFSDAGDDHIVVVLEKSPGLYEYLFWGPSLVKLGSWTGGMYFGGSSNPYYTGYRFFGANNPGWTETTGCPGSDGDYQNMNAAFVRCDSDSWTGKWIGIGNTTFGGGGYTGRAGASSVHFHNGTHGGEAQTPSIVRYSNSAFNPGDNPFKFQDSQVSQIDGRANLLPILWWVGRDGSTGSSGGYSPIGTLPTIFFTNGVGNGFVPTEEYTIGTDTYKMFPNFAVLKV